MVIDSITKLGPSPRAWGEPSPSIFLATTFRTIPTRVGRTIRPFAASLVLADHPHARGENYNQNRADPQSDGPSPRAWGEPVFMANSRTVTRTIPTRVGRTIRC